MAEEDEPISVRRSTTGCPGDEDDDVVVDVVVVMEMRLGAGSEAGGVGDRLC